MDNKKIGVILLIGFLFFLGGFFIKASDFTTPTNGTYIGGYENYTISFTSTVPETFNITFFNETSATSGSIFNISINISASQTVFTFVWNTAFVADDNYTIQAVPHNATSHIFNGTAINVTSVVVDNTAPTVNLTFPLNYTFVDNSTLNFNFSAFDTWDSVLSCNLKVDGTSVNSTIIVPWGVNLTSVLVSALSVDFGFHTWNVSCTDNAGNVNATPVGLYSDRMGGNFTLTDTIAPTSTSLSLSATSLTKDGSVTLTCSATDTISSSLTYQFEITDPQWSVSTSTGSSSLSYSDTSHTGDYDVRCRARDTTGNWGFWTSVQTFNVKSSATTSGGGGSGSGGGTTVTPTVTETTEISEGETENIGTLIQTVANNVMMGIGSIATFNMGTSSAPSTTSTHSITVSDITDTSVTLTIQSADPVELTLDVGDVKNVDVDSDSIDDLEITLNDITGGKADLTINSLVEVPVTPTAPVTEPTGEIPPTEKANTSTGLWIILIIVVVGIVAWFLFRKKK